MTGPTLLKNEKENQDHAGDGNYERRQAGIRLPKSLDSTENRNGGSNHSIAIE
jgi:hypothetical protein